ncbi:MAG: family 20 glycosylhydrolase, partial [Porticoccaceae bacterium]|nr:family 20 glycosylhydrolase [Porticoccaceae bacterium]
LGGYFIERISRLLDQKGIEVAGWSDGLSHTNRDNMPDFLQSNIWTTLPGGAHKVANKHLDNGWDVVLSIPDMLYFDLPYTFDPKETGYHWASRHTDTQHVFEFMPGNLPAHAEFRRDVKGQPFTADDRPSNGENGTDHRPLRPGERFAGIQGHLWSEMVRSERQAQYQLFPRILAVAERAWKKPA